jgi:hypothetical protein
METCTHCLGDIDPQEDTYTCYNGLYVCGACEDEEDEEDETPDTTADPDHNTNCLAGMRCPKCGALEPFRIVATMTVLMYDEGSDDDSMGGAIDWDSSSYCECHDCAHYGTVADFREKTL